MEREKDREVKWFTRERNPNHMHNWAIPTKNNLCQTAGSGMSDRNIIKSFQNHGIITLRKCSPDKEIVLLWSNSR